MARKHPGRRREPHRGATRRPQANPPHPTSNRAPEDQQLIRDLRQMLRAQPSAFLLGCSTMIELSDPRRGDDLPDARTMLLASFAEVDVAETTAALHVWAALLPEELERARLRRILAKRRQPVPPTVATLAAARVTAAWFMGDELGDGDNFILGVDWPGGERLTTVVYVDHNLGTIIKDAFLVDEVVELVVERYGELIAEQGVGALPVPMELADARARLEQAYFGDDGMPFEHANEESTWPAYRPLVRFLIGTMPEGGDAYPDQERVDDERIAELLEGFLGSAQALDLPRSSEVREAAELLLEYAADESGDPLRWSAVTVEVCLTQGVAWSPELTDDVAAVIPAVLRALIRWAHRELRVSPVATTEAVTSVDRWLPAFQRVRSLPSVRDYAEHSAVLRAAEGGDWGPWQRKAIEEAVGANAYDGFDSAPLPADEPLELSEVAPDIRAAVTEVGEWLDRFAESELGSGCGPEFRTACRRFLVGAATRDPEVFRRRARADLSALAVVWSVGRANQLIGYSPAPVRTGDVSAWFGARGVPSGRADTLIAAFTGGQRRWSGSVDLGDERVLVAERRRELVEMRESLAGETR